MTLLQRPLAQPLSSKCECLFSGLFIVTLFLGLGLAASFEAEEFEGVSCGGEDIEPDVSQFSQRSLADDNFLNTTYMNMIITRLKFI